jgi:hypothetical protein
MTARKCQCPRFATRNGNSPFLISHTPACLRAQRGGKSFDAFYGPGVPSVGVYTALARSGKVAQSSPLRDTEMSDDDHFDAYLTDPFTGNLA